MSRNTAILAYHAVDECSPEDDEHMLFITPDLFMEQMSFLACHRDVVSLAEALHRGPSRRPAVAITFDDGYRSIRDNALPVLEALGLPATVFVPTAVIGDRNRWDEPGRCRLDVMTREELLDVQSRGLAIESHGHAHVDLTRVSPETARADVERSVDIIESSLGYRSEFFAYPYGNADATLGPLLAQLGFRAAFTLARRDAGPYARERVPVLRKDPPWLYRFKTSGAFSAVRYSRLMSRLRPSATP